MNVDFKYIENWSIHNIENRLISLKNNDIVFFITEEKFSELERYAFIKLIEEYLKNNRFCENYDYNVSIFLCKYSSTNYSLNSIYNYLDKINYSLTINDLEVLTKLIKHNKLKEDQSDLNKKDIFGIKIIKTNRDNKSLIWRIKNKRKVIIKNYID